LCVGKGKDKDNIKKRVSPPIKRDLHLGKQPNIAYIYYKKPYFPWTRALTKSKSKG